MPRDVALKHLDSYVARQLGRSYEYKHRFHEVEESHGLISDEAGHVLAAWIRQTNRGISAVHAAAAIRERMR